MQQKSTRGVQQEDVSAAADALLAESVRPTIERVRVKLGRGSPNTVAPMLETWFAGLGVRLGVAPAADGQGGAPAAVRDAMERVWAAASQAAREQAEGALSADREALTAERQARASQREEIMGERVAAAERIAALQESLSEARRQIEEQVARAAGLQSQFASVQGELATSRTSMGRLVDERDADHRRFAEQLAVQAEERRRLEERASSAEGRLLGEVDRARHEAKQLASRLEQVQRVRDSEREIALREREDAMQRHSALEIQVASLTERLAAGEQRATELRVQLQEKNAAVTAVLARAVRQQVGAGQARTRRASADEKAAPRRTSGRRSGER